MSRRKQEAPSQIIDEPKTDSNSNMMKNDAAKDIADPDPVQKPSSSKKTPLASIHTMEQYILQTFGKKKPEPGSLKLPEKKNHTTADISPTPNTPDMQSSSSTSSKANGGSGGAGRQLSKAERYRWIIQEPKQPTHSLTAQSTQAIGSRTKKAPSENKEHEIGYNHKLFNSIVKGASDFKCKHCGEAFVKLEELTKHMYAKECGHYIENDVESKRHDGRKTVHIIPKNRQKSASADSGAGTSDRSAAKVLSCLRCGASFESLQDLSCHMVKTKHHEAIPIPTFSKTAIPTLKSSKPPPFPDLTRVIAPPKTENSSLLSPAAAMSNLSSSSLNMPGMGLPSLSLPYPKTLDAYSGPAIMNMFTNPFFNLRQPLMNWSLLNQQSLLSQQHLLQQHLLQAALQQAQKEDADECKSNSSDDTSGRISRTSNIVKNPPFQTASPVPSGSSDPTNQQQAAKAKPDAERRPKSADNVTNTNQAEPLDLSRKRQASSTNRSSPGPSKLVKCESPVIEVIEPTSDTEQEEPVQKPSSNVNNSNSTSPTRPLAKSPNSDHASESTSLHHLQRIKALTVGVLNKEDHAPPPPPPPTTTQAQRTNPIMAMENLVKSHMAR